METNVPVHGRNLRYVPNYHQTIANHRVARTHQFEVLFTPSLIDLTFIPSACARSCITPSIPARFPFPTSTCPEAQDDLASCFPLETLVFERSATKTPLQGRQRAMTFLSTTPCLLNFNYAAGHFRTGGLTILLKLIWGPGMPIEPERLFSNQSI